MVTNNWSLIYFSIAICETNSTLVSHYNTLHNLWTSIVWLLYMCELDGLLQTFAENVISIEPLEICLENWCSIFILATLYAHTLAGGYLSADAG